MFPHAQFILMTFQMKLGLMQGGFPNPRRGTKSRGLQIHKDTGPFQQNMLKTHLTQKSQVPGYSSCK